MKFFQFNNEKFGNIETKFVEKYDEKKKQLVVTASVKFSYNGKERNINISYPRSQEAACEELKRKINKILDKLY